MRRDRIGPPCRGSGRRTSPSCAPVNPFCHPLRARGPGRGLPAATGSLANALGRSTTALGLGRAFSPAFRARVWAPKNESGAASFDLLVSAARCGATGSGRHAADRVGEPLHRAPPLTPSVTLYARARARPWSARCYGVARQRDRSRQNSRGPRACFLSGISGSRVGAEESGAASFDLLVSAALCGATASGLHAPSLHDALPICAPPFTPSVTLYAREGQAVVCP